MFADTQKHTQAVVGLQWVQRSECSFYNSVVVSAGDSCSHALVTDDFYWANVQKPARVSAVDINIWTICMTGLM